MSVVHRVLGNFDTRDLVAAAAGHAVADLRREKQLTVTVHPDAVDSVSKELTRLGLSSRSKCRSRATRRSSRPHVSSPVISPSSTPVSKRNWPPLPRSAPFDDRCAMTAERFSIDDRLTSVLPRLYEKVRDSAADRARDVSAACWASSSMPPRPRRASASCAIWSTRLPADASWPR